MRKIETSFYWSDLDDLSKRNIFLSLAPFLPPNYPFKRVDTIFSWVKCEFILFLEGGVPCLRVSDQSEPKISMLIAAYKH